ncbi:MAG: thermonuclease family protein, partial [Clostridiales bacterium]|nr:thermonuclease family protein [Clostridiales bacterium]
IISFVMSISLIYNLYKKDIIEFNIGNRLEEVTITRVVDGDTVVVLRDGEEERIRLIGIDTPESVHPDKEKNTDIGELASEYTEDLLKEEMTVYIEFDKTERDFFGRLLAYVWLEDKVSPTKKRDIKKYMVNAILLQEGYAIAHKYPPNIKNHELFSELQEKAKKEEMGLWEEYGKEMKAITK